MLNFEFNLPTKIVFGKDQIESLNQLLKTYGAHRLLLVYGQSAIKKIGLYDQIINVLKKTDIEVIELSGIRPNPPISQVLEGRKLCLDHDVDFILAVGGGSVIDAAKAIAFAVHMAEDDVWPVITRRKTAQKALPIGTVLTLAATGTETNGNTVISNDETKEKHSTAYPFLRPQFSIIDPTHMKHVDHHHSIAGCIDIIMHVLEQYFDNETRNETSAYLSVGLIKSVIENTERLLGGSNDYHTRANIAWASTIAWSHLLQQGKTGDWATHRLSYPITFDYGITHGYALVMVFTAWMQKALELNPESMRPKLQFLADQMWLGSKAEAVPCLIQSLFASWGAPTSFKQAGLKPNDSMLKKLAKTTVSLGPVGKVITIDETLAHAIFQAALLNCKGN